MQCTASAGIRTRDLLITERARYRLSHHITTYFFQVCIFSSHVDKSGKGNDENLENETRTNLIQELMKTEFTYLENLMVVNDYFIAPIAQSNILTDVEQQVIFINWKDLMLSSNRLYK